MSLKNHRELSNTRDKLARLEATYAAAAGDAEGDQDLQAAELESLARMINQMKEEIARFQAHQGAGR